MVDDWLTPDFEAARPRLHAVAYRMLGSRAEADDAVQEAWLRLSRADASQIESFGGWLTTVISRVCLDRLRSRRARREEPIEAQPPGALTDTAGGDPANETILAESVGAALLVVLDLLTPAERVAFVLHDVFAVPFEQVSEILGRSPDATRQLASRARRRLQGSTGTYGIDLVRQRRVVDAFLRAARGGDFEALMRVLDPDVVLLPDAAAVSMGSLREARGATAVATALSGGARGAQLAIIDGVAGFVWAPGGQTRGVVEFTVRDETIVAINVTGDTDRIQRLDIVTIDD
ncbi:MAG: sigma-70 family RNA polymerase sigma factor [Acidimicrobiia bacterium]